MAFFVSSRTKFLNRFERSGNGLTYRETPRSRAIAVSEAERDWLVSEFDRADAQKGPVVFLAFGLAIAVSICVWQIPSAHAYAGAIFWLTVLGFSIACGLYFDRKARSFKRSRVFVDEGLSKTEAGRRERSNTSWASLLATLLFGAFFFRDVFRVEDPLTRFVLVAIGGMAAAYYLLIFFQKLKDRLQARQLPKL